MIYLNVLVIRLMKIYIKLIKGGDIWNTVMSTDILKELIIEID